MARNLTINFGLLSIPAKSDPATITPVTLANLCVGQPEHDAHDPVPLTAPKQCATCGDITDFERLVKGVPSGSGANKTFAITTQDEVAEAKESYAKEYLKKITLVPHDAATFLTATGVGKSLHYVTPADAASADHYALLARLIEGHPELAFAGLYTPQSATSLYRVTTRGGVLMLEQRTREQSMKPVPSVGGTVNEQFLQMLEMSLPMLTTPYDAAGYEDRYQDALTKMRTDHVASIVGQPSNVADDVLMAQFAALVAS